MTIAGHGSLMLPESIACSQAAPSDQLQYQLSAFNRRRLRPGTGKASWREELAYEHKMRLLEGEFVESERRSIRHLLGAVPRDPGEFVAWFTGLRDTGPGQGDELFPWLAASSSPEQFVWFLSQEIAGEAGFEDLVAMSQIKLSARPKLEMARNYWDEMGRGNQRGMHGPMLARLAGYFGITPSASDVVAESQALGNLMTGLAANRRYAFEAIGALGAIELTAPTRAVFVEQGLRRLGVPADARQYFAVHAILDVQHSETWNREILGPLVEEDSRCAQWIAEGAMMRLIAGQHCFEAYRAHFHGRA